MRLTSILTTGVLCAAMLFPTTMPAFAGKAESALLAKYAGSWRGTGKVTGPDPGTVVCRMTFKTQGEGKLSYTGRCSFGSNPAASFRGSMSYSDSKKRFEASSSAQGVSNTAVGKRQGGGVVFTNSGMESSYGTASSTMALTGGTIKMSFRLVDKDGEVTTSNITFKKG